jgi:quercetin dioxygenase-like cupin family protein
MDKESDMESTQIKQAWAARGFSYTLWTDPPGQVWKDFVHDVDEVVTLLEGEIELSFQGQTLRPRLGEEVLIPAGARHTVRNTGATTNRWCFGYKRT